MSAQQKLRERLKRQRDARLRSKVKSHEPYGATLEVFDRVQEQVRQLYSAFPSVVPKQIEHFVLPAFESKQHADEFASFPPELKDHVCRPICTPEQRTNNQRVRDVIRARQVVDASGGDPKVALKQHQALKKKYTKDFIEKNS